MDMFNTTTTAIPDQPGFEVLILAKRRLINEPIIAWAVETDTIDTENPTISVTRC